MKPSDLGLWTCPSRKVVLLPFKWVWKKGRFEPVAWGCSFMYRKVEEGPKHFGGLQNGTVCKSIFQTWGNGIGKNIIANLYTEEKSITRNWNLLSWLICRDMQQSYCKFVHREVFSANTEQLTNLLTVEHLRNITSVILCTLPRVQSQNEIITHGEG